MIAGVDVVLAIAWVLYFVRSVTLEIGHNDVALSFGIMMHSAANVLG